MMETFIHLLTLLYSHCQGHPTRAALYTPYLLVLAGPWKSFDTGNHCTRYHPLYPRVSPEVVTNMRPGSSGTNVNFGHLLTCIVGDGGVDQNRDALAGGCL